jgi:hypothetical protein
MGLTRYRSNEWYEEHKKPIAKPETHAVQRPSSSSSPQASAQRAGQTRPQFLTPGWHSRGTANQGRAVNTGPPNRSFASHYAQSEVGYYSTSITENNTANISRPSTGHVEFQANLTPSTANGGSQAMTADLLQFQHGLQNVSMPSSTGMQNQTPTWHRSEGVPGNQHAFYRRNAAQGQMFSNNVSSGQVLSQTPMRSMNAVYSSQTAPNPSIPDLPHRLNEDFENYGITQPHEELLAFGGSENDLAHVGTTDQFLASESHTANIGSDTSQEQAPDLHEDQQVEQGSSVPAADIRKFLEQHFPEKHFPNDTLDRATLAIQGTLQTLQSASLTGGGNSTSTSASAPDSDDFKTAMKDGKTVYLCSHPGCKKDMPRKCELRKHLKRHTHPWSCTIDTCRKPFGSKNDWTRHESKQHEQQECWRCVEANSNESGEHISAPSHDACKRVFYTKELYSKHLRQAHKFQNNDVIDKMCHKQRIGQKAQVQFWCGFCRKVLVLKQIGLAGISERYSHIDYHFSKETRSIEQWEPLNGRPCEGESALAAQQTSPPESCSSGGNEEEAGEGASGDARVIQSKAVQRASRKRPSSMMVSSSQGPAPKRAHRVRTAMAVCCHCGNVFQRWNGVCIGCDHRLCNNCAAEVVEQTDPDQM